MEHLGRLKESLPLGNAVKVARVSQTRLLVLLALTSPPHHRPFSPTSSRSGYNQEACTLAPPCGWVLPFHIILVRPQGAQGGAIPLGVPVALSETRTGSAVMLGY